MVDCCRGRSVCHVGGGEVVLEDAREDGTVHLVAYPAFAMAQVVMDVVLRLMEIPQKKLLFYSLP